MRKAVSKPKGQTGGCHLSSERLPSEDILGVVIANGDCGRSANWYSFRLVVVRQEKVWL